MVSERTGWLSPGMQILAGLGVVGLIAAFAFVGSDGQPANSPGTSASAAGGVRQQAARRDTAGDGRTIDSLLQAAAAHMRRDPAALIDQQIADELSLRTWSFTGGQRAKLAHLDSASSQRERAARALSLRADRVAYAKLLENNFLDESMDVTVTTGGSRDRTLSLKYILAGRVFAHQLQENDAFWDNMKKLGFTRVDLSDGYDYSVSWDVTPDSAGA